MSASSGTHGPLPDPGAAATLDELTSYLRALKVWAGDPSFTVIRDRITRMRRAAGHPVSDDAKRATVVDCFKPGRRRIDAELVVSIVRALHDDVGYTTQWRQALQVVSARTTAASQVRVVDALPPDLAEFVGRRAEVRRLLRMASTTASGFVGAIDGMAGVGKTQLAVHVGHLLADQRPRTAVLFVDLRGFHPDPNQPPADPAAVLDGFLRLLGVPAHRIPHGLAERSAAYRRQLDATRALVVLDNAVDEEQVRPLLAGHPGVVTLVTSRRRLRGLPAVHVPLDVFTVDEAQELLARTAPDVMTGEDPFAATRILRRCGRLPLALSLVSGRIRLTPGWTLTDHADRLDERHSVRRLDSDVEITLNLSYQNLPVQRRRLLRLLALHPGPDVDRYAVAAMASVTLDTATTVLDHLGHDNLVRTTAHGRFVLHDLVRAFVVERGIDEDSAAVRHDAMTRLLKYYLHAGAAAMQLLHPIDAGLRPSIEMAATPAPPLNDMWAARDWLDVERPALVAATAHAAGHGWPRYAVGLSTILYRYLVDFPTDALQIHTSAREAAYRACDAAGEAYALLGTSAGRCEQGQHAAGATDARQALALFRSGGDGLGEARALSNLGNIALRQDHLTSARACLSKALTAFQRIGNLYGAANALNSLGFIEIRLGCPARAVEHLHESLARYRDAHHLAGEVRVLTNLGNAEFELGRFDRAAVHLRRAVDLGGQVGNPICEANALECLGVLHTRLDRPEEASASLARALDRFRAHDHRPGVARALNSLGDLSLTRDDPTTAVHNYTAALHVAVDACCPDQVARARTGLRTASRRPARTGSFGTGQPT